MVERSAEASCASGSDTLRSFPAADTEDSVILLENLGFAKQSKYPWHPALKKGLLAKGSRVSVQFFGTGQSGNRFSIFPDGWLPIEMKLLAVQFKV